MNAFALEGIAMQQEAEVRIILLRDHARFDDADFSFLLHSNPFALEGIAMQQEAEVRIIESRVVAQQVAGETPQPPIELVQHVLALDTYLFDHLLIEVVEELFAGVALAFGNLRLQLPLKLVELEL